MRMERLKQLRARVLEVQLTVYAANAAFFLILSLLPLLALVLGLLGRLSLSRTDFFLTFSQLIPSATRPVFLETIRAAGSGTAMSVSALAGLWSASRGVYGLLQGLGRISTGAGNRIPLRLLAIVYTAGFVLALVATFALHNLGHMAMTVLRSADDGIVSSLRFVLHRRGGICFVFLTALFTLIYRTFPSGCHRTVRQVLPGGLAAAGGWVLFTQLFSLCNSAFTGRSRVYGSVAVMASTMLWLYFCLMIVLLGALINERP